MSTVNNKSDLNTDMMISRYMDVHNNKITQLLGYEEKQNVLSKYLRLRNKTGLNYLKPEIEGLTQELEQERLIVADLKKQLVRSEGDNVMTRLQNDELRRQIGRAEEIHRETIEKRIKVRFEIDKVYNEVFVQTDTMRLYDKTIQDLGKADIVEKACLEELQQHVQELREKMGAEQAQRDELKQIQVVQRKQIETLGLKHDRGTETLERNLNGMNDCINEAVKRGHVSVK